MLTRSVPGLVDKPSIAVLPFANMSDDPGQEHFADGIVEDIITALSRVNWLFVIARNSSFTYKGRDVDVKQIGRELGVRYILQGSVRKAAGQVRISGQLIDTSTGANLWADKFDGDLENIFDLQDLVTARVAGAIAPKLEQVEIERAKRKPAANLDAYDCYLRGMAAVHRWSQEANAEALSNLYRAIELDQDSLPPMAWQPGALPSDAIIAGPRTGSATLPNVRDWRGGQLIWARMMPLHCAMRVLRLLMLLTKLKMAMPTLTGPLHSTQIWRWHGISAAG